MRRRFLRVNTACLTDVILLLGSGFRVHVPHGELDQDGRASSFTRALGPGSLLQSLLQNSLPNTDSHCHSEIEFSLTRENTECLFWFAGGHLFHTGRNSERN